MSLDPILLEDGTSLLLEDGTEFLTETSSAGTDYAAVIDTTSLADGDYTLTIIAVDSGGLTGTDTTTITVDNGTGPTFPTPAAAVRSIISTRTRWNIFVRDSALQRVAAVDNFTRLDFVLRHNDAGTWVFDCPDGTPAALALVAPGAGIVVERNNTVVFSGPVTDPKRSRDDTGARTLEVSGVDDLGELKRRVLKPEPANSSPPYSTNAFDARTGPASTLILGYIDSNAGLSATPERRLRGLTVAGDPVVGSSEQRTARYGNLLLLVQTIAWASVPEVTLTVVQSGATLVASVAATRDLSQSVVFALETATLGAFSYDRARAEENYAFVGGGGTGTTRTIVEVQDAASVIRDGRAEVFLDHRDTSNTTQLAQVGTADFVDKAAKTTLTMRALPMGVVAWPDTWALGDLVTAVIDGVALADRIREIEVTVDATGETVVPSIGAPNQTNPRASVLFTLARRLSNRIATLETAT